MPYPVLPPPSPPPLIEAQPTEHRIEPRVVDAAPASPESSSHLEHSRLGHLGSAPGANPAAPDTYETFPPEYAQNTTLPLPNEVLPNEARAMEAASTSASSLGGPIGIGLASGGGLVASRSSSASVTELGALESPPFQGSFVHLSEDAAPVSYTTTALDIEDLSSAEGRSPLEARVESGIEPGIEPGSEPVSEPSSHERPFPENESSPLPPVLGHSTKEGIVDPDELDEAIARRYATVESDLNEIAPELLDPLRGALQDLYQLAQEIEAEALTVEEADEGSIDEGSAEESVEDTRSGGEEDASSSDEPDIFDGSIIPDAPSPGESEAEAEELDNIEPIEESIEEPGEGIPSETFDPTLSPGETLPDGTLPNGTLPEESAPGPVPLPATTVGSGDEIELTSDRQTYDINRRIFSAEGNAEMIFRGGILNADRIQANLIDKIVVAQGNVAFTRGEQVLRGDRIEYNLVSEEGSVRAARGEIFLPGVSSDLGETRTDAAGRTEEPLLSEQLSNEQPTVETAVSTGGLRIGLGSGSGGGVGSGTTAGDVRQLRFEADNINFTPDGWEATNVRITNDPFSPPELELRTERATFRRLSPTRSELIARNPRLVFDQGLSLPLFRERFIFDENRRNQALFQFGYDEDDRGGLYIERAFEPIALPFARLSIRPQFFVQRALGGDPDDESSSVDNDDNSGIFDPDSYGLIAELDIDINTRTSFEGRLEMTSLDFADFEDEARGSVRLQRQVLPVRQPGTQRFGFHTLTAEYSYRDRLFNGTLGFQNVQRTFGLVLTSPTIRFSGDPNEQGLELTYQAAIQRVNANVDPDRRDDLLPPPPRDNVRTSLNRYQIAAELRRPYTFWTGTPLPATPDEGLKYTPSPVVPFLSVIPSVRGVASFYSNGDTQPVLTGQVTLLGQFGHFSRPYLDYFGFNLTYRRSTEGSESPFSFDRINDREVLSGGITVQLFGPFRAGFRTSISLDEDEEFDTSYFIEYSRRTYGITLSYNPDREIGSLGLRLSDFTWTGTPEPFDGDSSVRTVESGVVPVERDDAPSTDIIVPPTPPQEPPSENPSDIEPSDIDSSDIEPSGIPPSDVPPVEDAFPEEAFPTESSPVNEPPIHEIPVREPPFDDSPVDEIPVNDGMLDAPATEPDPINPDPINPEPINPELTLPEPIEPDSPGSLDSIDEDSINEHSMHEESIRVLLDRTPPNGIPEVESSEFPSLEVPYRMNEGPRVATLSSGIPIYTVPREPSGIPIYTVPREGISVNRRLTQWVWLHRPLRFR